jgi:hypothetical protein
MMRDTQRAVRRRATARWAGPLALGLAVLAGAPGPATADEATWHAEALSSLPSGLQVTAYWSKGNDKLRAETVVAGHRVVTIVNGPLYHTINATTGRVLTIERSKRAVAADGDHPRPFGTEGWAIQERGGEKVREDVLAGRKCDVWRLTDSQGRREVWIHQEPEDAALPLRVEVYYRQAGTEIRTDYIQWASGLELPDHLFEPDPRFEVTRVGYQEYVERSGKGELKIAPVLHSHLLHGPK